MSFKAGEFYQCVAVVPSLTQGKIYKCEAVAPHPSQGVFWIRVVNDRGLIDGYHSGNFDPTPVRLKVSQAAATLQQQVLASMSATVPAMKTSGVPKCKCGATPKLQTYMTFSFYYCEACKAEVGGKAEEPAKADNGEEWTIPASASWSSNFRAPSLYGVPVAPSAPTLPAGTSGLKGESVTCSNCHAKVGILNADLPDPLSAYRWSTYRHIDYIMPCGCGDPEEVRNGRIHVAGRGWV